MLKAGANLAALNDDGRTPLSLANEHNEIPAVRQALLAAGAGRVERQIAAAKAQRKARSGGGSGGLGALIAAASVVGVGTASGASTEAILAGVEAVASSQQAATGGGQQTASKSSRGTAGSATGGGSCQVPGYPNPPGGVANLGFSWCPASVSLQVRSFALQAAGAECAIATGSSSTPEQIEARQREIRAACDRLSAMGQGNCQCPPGLGQ